MQGWDSVPGVLDQAKGNAKSSFQAFKDEAHSMAGRLQEEYQQGAASHSCVNPNLIPTRGLGVCGMLFRRAAQTWFSPAR